ncbi:MAG: hypothetical protein QOD80_91 [Verrucomicrobiota bacterium]
MRFVEKFHDYTPKAVMNSLGRQTARARRLSASFRISSIPAGLQ